MKRRLHQPDVRARADLIVPLIHPALEEAGYSGRRIDKQSLLNDLPPASVAAPILIWSQDFVSSTLTANCALLRYRSARLEPSEALPRWVERSSLWVHEPNVGWLLWCHQGTPTQAFVKHRTGGCAAIAAAS